MAACDHRSFLGDTLLSQPYWQHPLKDRLAYIGPTLRASGASRARTTIYHLSTAADHSFPDQHFLQKPFLERLRLEFPVDRWARHGDSESR